MEVLWETDVIIADTRSDAGNLALLCWTHHRQVDLTMWTIEPIPDGDEQPPQPQPGAPRHHLARQPQRALHHRPHTTPPLAPVNPSVRPVDQAKRSRPCSTSDVLERQLSGCRRSSWHLERMVCVDDWNHSCGHVVLGQPEGDLLRGTQAITQALHHDRWYVACRPNELGKPAGRRSCDRRPPGRVQREGQEQQCVRINLLGSSARDARSCAATAHDQPSGPDPPGAHILDTRHPRRVQCGRCSTELAARDPPGLLEQDHLDAVGRQLVGHGNKVRGVDTPTEAMAENQRGTRPTIGDRVKVGPRHTGRGVDVPDSDHEGGSPAVSAGIGSTRSAELLRTEFTAVLTG